MFRNFVRSDSDAIDRTVAYWRIKYEMPSSLYSCHCTIVTDFFILKTKHDNIFPHCLDHQLSELRRSEMRTNGR